MWLGGEAKDWHFYDEPLAKALCCRLCGESVIDLGCGLGDYVAALATAGSDAVGYDGNPSTPERGGRCFVGDLTKPWLGLDRAPRRRDWVLSLEVAEHIPVALESSYLSNVDALNRKGVILSWATPGQGGLGHVNEQPNDYVIKRMVELGYEQDSEASAYLREAATLEWFKGTILVFVRAGGSLPSGE